MTPVWRIDGKSYDLTDFIAAHPGGEVALRFGKGGDCTALFNSYHLMRRPPASLLARYEVKSDPTETPAEATELPRYTFLDDGFYATVKKRVREHFKATKQKTGASLFWQVLAVTMIAGTAAMMIPAFVYGSVLAALAHGFLRAMTSIGPGHSISHFSVFPRGRWNALVFRLTSPVLVSNPAIWSTAHVVSHHVDTLTPTDLQDNYPLKRIQPALPHRGWHRVQHLYVWLVYLLGLPLWTLEDFVLAVISLFTGKHGDRPFPLAQRVETLVAIAANIALTIALPFFFLDFWRALLVCACSNVVASSILVIQIAVNHEVPEAMGTLPAGRIDWGAHQVLTSHNFDVGSSWALHFAGGLNMQIEHHLFPGVHYSHYPALAGIVERTCVEFGLPYHQSSSLAEAIGKHYAILRTNSVP